MVDQQAQDADTAVRPCWRVLHEIDVARLVAQHATLRKLCDELELCADRLPERAAVSAAASISEAFAATLHHNEIVEQPTLRNLFDADRPAAMLDQIRAHHAVDHLLAEDLHDALEAAAATIGPIRSDALSYMMRCLFDGCRRAIEFQEAAVLMLARDRLTPAARLSLTTG